MPWIPKKDALRKFREAAGYSILGLAAKIKVSERQIRTIESENPPGSIQLGTLISFSKTLGCANEDLATWIARKPTVAIPEPKPVRQRLPRDGRPRTVEQVAKMEREVRLAGTTLSPILETPDGTLELLGAERAVEIRKQYGAFEGHPFFFVGMVDEHEQLPDAVARRLGIDGGVGAQFKLTREVFVETTFSVVAITQSAELTRLLIDLHRDKQVACLLLRVLVARPKNKWKGFTGLDAKTAPIPYTFVVEKPVVGELPPWAEQSSEEASPQVAGNADRKIRKKFREKVSRNS